MKTFTINVWAFLLNFLVYCFISAGLLGFAYVGWISLYAWPVIGAFFVMSLIAVLIGVCSLTHQKKYFFTIPLRGIFTLGVFQIIATLLGGGDCGDEPGIHMLLQVLISKATVCKPSVYETIFQTGLPFLALIAYGIYLVYFLRVHVFQKTKKTMLTLDTTTNEPKQ